MPIGSPFRDTISATLRSAIGIGSAIIRVIINLLFATSTRNSPTTVWQKSASIGLSLFVVDPMLPSIGAAANAIVSCWGDSFTEGQGVTPTYPSQVETLSGYTVFNGGVGGETSSQILTRFLASNVEFKNSTVFWMGRNNYSDGVQVKADIASAISGMNDSSINYLVAEILPGDFADEYLGGVNRPVIDQLNADLEVLYGDRFVRILPSLLEAYDPEDAQDVIDVGNGITPSTLRIDDLHLTSAGYGIVANLINTKMSSIFTGLNQANSLIIESAAINLCTCVKANPTDTTNIIKAGDAAGVLSVVDDSVNLALAGLDGVCSSGKVYKLDNSLGVGSAFAIISGITALTNSMSIYARFTTVNGNAFLTNDDLADAVLLSEGGYIRTKRENKAISGPDDRLTIRANQGAIVYFILPQLEESPITSSIIIGADTAASATRDAEVIHVATPTFVQQDGNWAFKFKGTPAATAQALKALFSFDSDATNYTEIQLNAANITANSVLGGVSNGAAVGLYSHTADVQFETNVYYVASTKTLGIRSDDVSGDISAVEFVEDILTSHPVITAVLSTGNRNSANQAICNLDNDGVPVFFASKENAGW